MDTDNHRQLCAGEVLFATLADACAGDAAAAAWLAIMAPDLADDEERMHALLLQDDAGIMADLSIAEAWDHYQESVAELAFGYPE